MNEFPFNLTHPTKPGETKMSTAPTNQPLTANQQRANALMSFKAAVDAMAANPTPTIFDWGTFLSALATFIQQIIPLMIAFITGSTTPNG